MSLVINLVINFSIDKWTESMSSTVNSEMFVKILFSLIFANWSPREFNVLANIVKTNL